MASILSIEAISTEIPQINPNQTKKNGVKCATFNVFDSNSQNLPDIELYFKKISSPQIGEMVQFY